MGEGNAVRMSIVLVVLIAYYERFSTCLLMREVPTSMWVRSRYAALPLFTSRYRLVLTVSNVVLSRTNRVLSIYWSLFRGQAVFEQQCIGTEQQTT